MNNDKYIPLKLMYLCTVFVFVSLDSVYNIPFSMVLRWILPMLILVISYKYVGGVVYPNRELWTLVPVIFGITILYSIDRSYSIQRLISYLLITAMFFTYYKYVLQCGGLRNVIYYLGVFFILYQILNTIYLGNFADRAKGITGNPNSLGLWSNIAFVFALYYYQQTKGKLKHIFFIIVMLMSIYTAIAAGSRTYTICIMINIIFSFIYIFEKKHSLILFFGMLGLATVVFFNKDVRLWISNIQGIQRLFNEGTTRGAVWDAGLLLFKKKPILGWGYGTNQQLNTIEYLGYIEGYGDYGFAFHNSYLTVMIETGIVGLIAILIHFGKIIFKGIRTYLYVRDRTLLFVLILIFNMLICFYGGSSMTSVGSTEGFFFWGLLMWVYVYYTNLDWIDEIRYE